MKREVSPRRVAWSRIGILTPIFAIVLGSFGVFVVPTVLGLQGPSMVSDGLFSVGIVGLLAGLVGLGFTPRRTSGVYRTYTGQSPRTGLMVGIIALSLAFAGVVLLVLAAVMGL